jgi:hypothetical protein
MGKEFFGVFQKVNFCKTAVYPCAAVPLWFKRGERFEVEGVCCPELVEGQNV